MANYTVANESTQQATAAAFKTQIAAFCGATPRRGVLYDYFVGFNQSPPADNEIEIDIARMTVDGTGTAFTPNPLDPADAAALTTAKIGYTAEPTVTANSFLDYFVVNQRATVRWLAAPGSELIWPATAANGLVLRAKSAAYTGTIGTRIQFIER
jgi:hypothetical protein